MDCPNRETELAIPNARLCGQIIEFVQSLRKEDLRTMPGIAEMLDFAAALAGLGINDLTEGPATLAAALATLLKTEADRATIPAEVAARFAGKAG